MVKKVKSNDELAAAIQKGETEIEVTGEVRSGSLAILNLRETAWTAIIVFVAALIASAVVPPLGFGLAPAGAAWVVWTLGIAGATLLFRLIRSSGNTSLAVDLRNNYVAVTDADGKTVLKKKA